MTDCPPRVVSREALVTTPWVTLLCKEVASNENTESYYSLEVPDYVAVVARTPSGKVPFVRQYRPAVEEFTLELPAGTLEKGETPEQCCVRELREEVGLEALSVHHTGSHWPDTGRLENLQHTFLVEASEADSGIDAELEVVYLTPAEIESKIRVGEIRALLHISALYMTGILPAR